MGGRTDGCGDVVVVAMEWVDWKQYLYEFGCLAHLHTLACLLDGEEAVVVGLGATLVTYNKYLTSGVHLCTCYVPCTSTGT